tara:strand:+ start:2633 stop:3103 length:471 start_codon:yes stop_codon:yes gene_type:complete
MPGQSLTDDPDNPNAWEKPPQFTSIDKASEYLFEFMIEEERYMTLIDALEEGMTIMEITQLVLFEGFRNGKWNPDLMMLLIEPVAYTLMALAERVNVDYVVEEDDEDDQEMLIRTKLSKDKALNIQKAKGQAETKIPKDLKEKIEQVPQASLMERR